MWFIDRVDQIDADRGRLSGRAHARPSCLGGYRAGVCRASEDGANRRVTPAPAAAVDAGLVERIGDGPIPLAQLAMLADLRDGGLFPGVLDHALGVRRIGLPTV